MVYGEEKKKVTVPPKSTIKRKSERLKSIALVCDIYGTVFLPISKYR